MYTYVHADNVMWVESCEVKMTLASSVLQLRLWRIFGRFGQVRTLIRSWVLQFANYNLCYAFSIVAVFLICCIRDRDSHTSGVLFIKITIPVGSSSSE